MAQEEIALSKLIDITQPFCLYALCEINYDGRACSTLKQGNYLILYKNDGSLLVHGGDKTIPKNYQSAGAKLTIEGSTLISKRNKEIIRIKVDSVIFYKQLELWAEHSINIIRTESDLVNKLCNNIVDYLNFVPVQVLREYSTDLGKVDICAVDDCNRRHLIEVKRVKATKNHCNQLRKYIDCVEGSIGYLAAPDISDKTLGYMKEKGYNWIKVEFDL